ncbi:integrase core domain-containing protein [Ralstonia solanacearum]|uniref:integrase core domain-containing protein n=1 Tax=Ralstonia solanacearum TaxID=305 RepID=UPI003D683EFF
MLKFEPSARETFFRGNLKWRIEYNTERPHSSLGYMTPVQFAQGHEQKEFLTSDSTCASY